MRQLQGLELSAILTNKRLETNDDAGINVVMMQQGTCLKGAIIYEMSMCCICTFLSLAPQIGFDPDCYTYDEETIVARFTITTNMPLRFTDATVALFYTEDGSATGGGGKL